MKHVTSDGAVWQMSDKNFKKLAAAMKRNGGYVEDLDEYGRLVIGRLIALDEIVGEVYGYEGRDEDTTTDAR